MITADCTEILFLISYIRNVGIVNLKYSIFTARFDQLKMDISIEAVYFAPEHFFGLL